jgi:hypothetical protein
MAACVDHTLRDAEGMQKACRGMQGCRGDAEMQRDAEIAEGCRDAEGFRGMQRESLAPSPFSLLPSPFCTLHNSEKRVMLVP